MFRPRGVGLLSAMTLLYCASKTLAANRPIDIQPGGTGTFTVSPGGTGSFTISPFCQGIISTDTFTESGSGDILLNTHTSDSGSGWLDSETASSALINLDRTNDHIKSTNSATAIAYVTQTLCSENYSATLNAAVNAVGGAHRIGVVVHYASSIDIGYEGRITGPGAWEIRRRDVGAQVILGSGTISGFSSSTFYDIKLESEDDVYSLYLDDVLQGSRGDSTYTGAGNVGVLISESAARGNTFESSYLP